MIEINEKKRVNIDDSGILTIGNDNGKWVHGDTSTNIEGDYVISAESLQRLMVMMTENPMMICNTYTSWYAKDYMSNVSCELITTDKEISEEVTKMNIAYKKAYEEVERMNIAYKKANDELEVVKREKDLEKVTRINFEKKIEEFNKTRHWWERKLE